MRQHFRTSGCALTIAAAHFLSCSATGDPMGVPHQRPHYGALLGVFNIDGRDDLAYFYFKDIDGVIADEFWVVSAVDR